jgi:hypothetical protein
MDGKEHDQEHDGDLTAPQIAVDEHVAVFFQPSNAFRILQTQRGFNISQPTT